MKKNVGSGRNRKASGQQGVGEIRLIGGDFRGRKLPVCLAEGLRPTSDRVRETVFNWLQFDMAGAVCLDVFAGSGALGLEALSRGAAWVTLIEKNPKVAAQLRQNLHRLKVDASRATVIEGEACEQLALLAQSSLSPFHGIFLDPPFQKGLMQPVLDLIFRENLIHPQGWLYLEQEKSLPWPQFPKGWQPVREKATVQVKYGLFAQTFS